MFVTRHNCPVCFASESRVLREVSYTDPRIRGFVDSYYEGRVPEKILSAGNYKIAFCELCGLLYQVEVLDSEHMFELYENWISASQSLDKKRYADIDLFRGYSRTVESLAAIVRKKPFATRVLEFGSGWGFFGSLAQAYGFDVTGVELSKVRRDFSQKRSLRVMESLQDLSPEKFDLIYSNQVLEHVDNPRVVLQELSSLLADNGVLMISVPNGRKMRKQLAQSDWAAGKDPLHPLEHINCFTHKTLARLADVEGMEVVSEGLRWERFRELGLVGGLKHWIYGRWVSTTVFMMKKNKIGGETISG